MPSKQSYRSTQKYQESRQQPRKKRTIAHLPKSVRSLWEEGCTGRESQAAES